MPDKRALPSSSSFSAGACVDPLKRADWTPLMLACAKRDSQPVIHRLIQGGANPHLTNKDRWSPFHIACREGDEEVVGYLLDVDDTLWSTVSNNGRTPLHTAGKKLMTEDLVVAVS